MDPTQITALREHAAARGVRLSEIVRSALGSYLAGLGAAPAATPTPTSRRAPKAAGAAQLSVVNGLKWADFDDPVQRALAIVELSGADRADDPPVLPYRSSAGENPKSAAVEALETTEQMWAWVDRYLLAPVEFTPAL